MKQISLLCVDTNTIGTHHSSDRQNFKTLPVEH